MTAPQSGEPVVVWMVRELIGAHDPGYPVALFPDEAAAFEFTGRLEHVSRHYVIERWKVPGLE